MTVQEKEEDYSKAPTWKELGYFPYRYLVAVLAFFGMVMNYILRININLAIVAMVAPISSEDNTTIVYNECGFDDGETEDDSYTGEFPWNEIEQGFVLSSFFWGYLWLQLPGGRLAEVIGPRKVFGGALLGAALLTLLEPVAAYWSYYALIVVRVLMGLITGVTFPSTHALLTRWAPPQERAFMSAFVYAGSQAGTVIGYPLTGVLITQLGWEAVFYVEGAIGLIWALCWFILVPETPEASKWMKEKEKTYIRKNVGDITNSKPIPIPWKKVIFSVPMWAILVADVGNNWGFYTLLTDLPLYMKEILKQDITSNSLLSGGPYLGMWISSIIMGYISDYLLKNKLISVTKMRKLATGIAHIGSGVALMCIPLVECDRTAIIVFLFLAVAANGAIYSGFMINHMDIAPNFAASLFGITNGAAAISGLVAPIAIGALTNNNQTLAQWRIVFFLAAGIYFADIIFYFLFASGKEQEWNRIMSEEYPEIANQHRQYMESKLDTGSTGNLSVASSASQRRRNVEISDRQEHDNPTFTEKA